MSLLVTVLGLALVVAFLVSARRQLLTRVIETRLQAQGIADARFGVAEVGWQETRLVNVAIGNQIRIKDITLSYSPDELVRGRLKGITVTGLVLDVSEPDQGILGTLRRLPPGPVEPLPLLLPPIHVRQAEVRGATAKGSFSIAVDGVVGSDLSATLVLKRGKARFRAGGRELAVEKLEGNLTASARGAAFAYALQGMVRQEGERPLFVPLSVTADGDFRQGRIGFKAEIRARGAPGQVMVDGTHDVATNSGEAALTLAPITFTKDGPQPRNLVPPLAVLKAVSGTVQGDVKLRWSVEDGDRVRADGEARVRLGDLSFETQGVVVEGLSGSLHLDRLNPVEIAKTQELRARRVTSVLSLEAPVVRFRYGPSGKGALIYVDRAEAGIAGGRISVSNAVLDTAAEANRFQIDISRVDLERLMRLLAVEGVSGQGSLDGVVPIELRGNTVVVRHGVIKADGEGRLRFRSAKAIEALKTGGDQVKLLLQALDDFRYTRLALTIDKPAGGDSQSRLSTAGRNPAVLEGRPFVININLSGNLDRLLGPILEGYRLSGRAIRATVGARSKGSLGKPP